MNLRNRSFLIIGIAAVILVGGAAAYQFMIKPGLNAPPSAAMLQSWQFQGDKLTTNLQGGNIIQIQFTFQAPNATVAAELTSRASQVDDAVMSVLHGLTASQIDQPGGYKELKSLVKNHVNSFLDTGKVSQVYIDNAIIQ